MFLKLPRAMLLDLDDTILDDTSAVERCWRDACHAHQAEVGNVDPDTLYDAVRRHGQWFWSDPERHRIGRLNMDAARAEVVRLALAEFGINRNGLPEKIAGIYSAHRDARMEPLPDAIETVRWLRSQQLKLALVTNGAGDAQQRKITRFDLAGLFDCILVEGEVGFGKPDERIYRRALEALRARPEETWMVGDNLEFDIAAPQQIGLFTIWIDRKGAGVPPGSNVRPNLIIGKLSDLRTDVFGHRSSEQR
jgi:putative hydrolase of the HAD superfamily